MFGYEGIGLTELTKIFRRQLNMDSKNIKDPRNALASWNGYEFQGQIALIVVLEMLIEKKVPVEKCELMLEDLEDFSIYCDGERVSIHQVKATSDKNISDYKEALYKMAVSLRNNSNSGIIAYLHTSNMLHTRNWKDDVKSSIEGFVPETEKQLNGCLSDCKEIKRRVDTLKARYREKGSFKTRKRGGWEDIYRSMDDVEQASEITSENLKKAIENYLNNLPKVDLSKDKLLERILYYKYHRGNNIGRKETRECIEKLIKEYWGDEKAEIRKGSEHRYRYALQEIIHHYVAKNHEGNMTGDRIKFTEIKCILDTESIGTREYKILRNKDLFFEKLEEYCEDECAHKRCEGCDLYEKSVWLKGLTNQEIERVFHLMSPHVNKKLEEDSNVVKEDGLTDSFFYTLNHMKFAKIIHNAKVIYQEGKGNCMLTDIYVSRGTNKNVIRGVINNSTIEEICAKIMENKEFAKERMEIDALIVSNPSGEIIKIGEMCKTLVESTKRRDDWSYLKITEKKDVCMIDSYKFVEEHK